MLFRGLLRALPLVVVAHGASSVHPSLRLREESGAPVNEAIANKKFIVELDAVSDA